jgi:short-subunit dehydrogenase
MSIVITGATGGVGKEVARLYASKGNDLILIGRCDKKLAALCGSIQDKYKINVDSIVCDARNKSQVDACIKEVVKKKTCISILINIAGVFPFGAVIDTNENDFNDCIDINVKYPYLLSMGLFELLKREGGGKIINIGSSSSYSGFKNTVLYSASKHALLGLSRALHDEWKELGVTVHCISPGTIDTEMAEVLDQDKTTYIKADEFSELIYDVGRYNGNMLVEEVRATRRIIR